MPHRHRLDVGLLERSVSCLFGAGLAPVTLRAYQSGYSRYQQSCEGSGIALIRNPTSEQALCLLVAFLANKSIAHFTQKCPVSGAPCSHSARFRKHLLQSLCHCWCTGLTGHYAVDDKSQMAATISNHSRFVVLRLKDHWASRVDERNVVMV